MSKKLDMSKAYNRVEWCFVENVMKRLGFNQRQIAMIMECVSTVSYSILTNAEPKSPIVPSRGLRQGDPLSPYLFLLCGEGLTSLLRRAENEQRIIGINICRRAPQMSHLFFADDNIHFLLGKQKKELAYPTSPQNLQRSIRPKKLIVRRFLFFLSKNTSQAEQVLKLSREQI